MRTILSGSLLLAAAISCSAQNVTMGVPQAVPATPGASTFSELKPGQTAQAARISEIQAALKQQGFDGWLFCDFRGSDILIPRILNTSRMGGSRRWYYYVPASGEPVKVVHAIEPGQLDSLPGQKLIYREWQLIQSNLKKAIFGSTTSKKPRIAMQYSPNNDIPYIARVDAGTVEMVRSLGVNVESSADLVQQFEAVWTPEQLALHTEAAVKMQKVILETFAEIKRRINADIPTNENDVQNFMMKRYGEEGLNPSPMDVSVNANAASPHYFPRPGQGAPIKRGDLVLIDTVSKVANKQRAPAADLTWVGYVGETVPEEYVKVWNIVYDAQQSALKAIRDAFKAGRPITGAQADDISRGVIRKAGYADQFLHRTGHSIGEEGHGNGANIDNLETRDSRRLIPGTAFSLEPGIYLEGKFGIRSEIDVYINGSDVVVTAPHQTEIIAIMK